MYDDNDTDARFMTVLDEFGKTSKRFYPTRMCGTVRDALTGVWLGVKQGSEDEAAFFKVIVSTGEVHERDKMLYFETIDNYVRFFGTRPSQMAVQSFTERRDEWSRKRKQQEREQQQQQVV